jgi:hypothetical protein
MSLSRVALQPESNAKYLTIVCEGVTAKVEDAGSGKTKITLESDSPDTSTALGIAILSWMSRTSWDKLGGFEAPKEKRPRKRRKRDQAESSSERDRATSSTSEKR